ncbi:hypothetical protein MRB53_031709 [Persea americana]|uniref:Uncharacterized protein n=1 Tax=Persea americana TaxID=3435 RepID=A0ACC2KQ94_PERAE|nr:hypothetical protein MRB53_031709 [Persea americana]
MDFNRTFFLLVAFSAPYLIFSNLRKWQRRQIVKERLRIIAEILEHAEERVIRYQERHDRILNQMNSYYFYHRELEEALAGARKAMNEALEFSVSLRRMQMKLITSSPDENLDVLQLDRTYRNVA